MLHNTHEDRIRSLERRLRRCHLMLAAIVLFGTLAVMLGQAQKDDEQVMRMRRLVIENTDKSSIQIGKHTDEKGNERFGIFLVDAKATPRGMLTFQKGVPYLMLVDKNGVPRVSLIVPDAERGGGEMVFYNSQSQPQISLLSHRDMGVVKIERPKSGAEIMLGATDDGWAALRARGNKELPTATMGFIKELVPTGFHIISEPTAFVRTSLQADATTASLRFWDEKKNERGVLSVGDNGSTRFAVKGSSNAGLTTGVTSDGDVTFHVTDRDGKPVFKAP